MSFNYESFKASFNGNIKKLETAEKITRELLRDMSREVLYALHAHENIGVVNQLMAAKITPVNKKALALFMVEFTGFNMVELTNGDITFTKKNKAKYDAIREAVLTRLDEDPHFNFWTWADRNIEIKSKEFDLEAVKKLMESTVKKAEKAGIPFDVLLATMLSNPKLKESLPNVLEAMAQQ